MFNSTEEEKISDESTEVPTVINKSIDPKHPHPSWMRWAILTLLCFVIYSFVYCYDNPFAIQNQLIDTYGLTELQYNLLYAVYGYVNIIAPFIAGLLVDWIGINSSTLTFYILIVMGHSLWIIGCFDSVQSFPLMATGRAIFGVGAEQMHLSRKWILFEWFTGMEYYFASGLSLSFSRMGSASQSYVSTHLYNKSGIVAVLTVGWILVVISLLLLIIFLVILNRYDDTKGFSKLTDQTTEKQMIEEDMVEMEEVKKFNLMDLCKGGFDRRFWFLGFTLIFFYSTYLSYSNVGSAFLQNRYQFEYEEGNSIAPITFWIAAIATPIFGIICDCYGKRCIVMLLAGICLLMGHLFLGFIGSAEKSIAFPIIGLVLLGMGYSLGAAAIWPSFGLIVKQKYLATTLGIWGSIDNGFQACSFLVVGVLTKDYTEEERDLYTDQYDDCRYFWIALAIGTIIWTLLLWYSDRMQFDNILWFPEMKFRGDSDGESVVNTPETKASKNGKYTQVSSAADV